MLLALMLSVGLAGRALAQNAAPVALLQSAHATLAGADHDYDGHRIAAMHQIEAALRDLAGNSAVGRTHRVHYKHVGKVRNLEPQAASDAKLRSAQEVLQTAAAELSGSPLKRVNKALAQLNTALGIR